MTELETIRLIGEIFGLAGIGATIIFKLTRLGWKLHERLDHLDGCVDDLKIKVLEKAAEHSEMREDYTELREELVYLKGVIGVPKDKPVNEPPGELK